MAINERAVCLEVVNDIKTLYPRDWAYKIPDTGGAPGTNRPFDIVWCRGGLTIGLEMKAMRAPSVSINSLPEHQMEALIKVIGAGGMGMYGFWINKVFPSRRKFMMERFEPGIRINKSMELSLNAILLISSNTLRKKFAKKNTLSIEDLSQDNDMIVYRKKILVTKRKNILNKTFWDFRTFL